jgi:hypothetical protein
MVRISRYILVLTAVIAAATVLPNLYWTIMEKPVKAPLIRYSCTDKTFMIFRSGPTISRQDSKGNSYSRDEYERKLPMLYYVQLASTGKLPDSINGVELDLHTIHKASSNYTFQPKNMDGPQPGLYPLFESESGRVNLEMPNDFFGIKERLEFIDPKTNKVSKEKSTLFSSTLEKRGFTYPSMIIAGIPTVKKSCDEGYLLTDAREQLFHLKMIEGKPFVKKINLPEGLTFKWIECVDFANKRYYAYLISSSNKVFVLMQDTYELKQLPIEGFNANTDDLKINGDLFNYNIITEGNGYINAVALDNQFNKIDQYAENWDDRYHRLEGKIFKYLFPFEINLKNDTSKYIDFRLNFAFGFNWILLSLLLIVVEIIRIAREKKPVKNHLIDLCIIAFTGIFGFIAVNIFPDKSYQ